jgi:hypothetical protein
MCIDNPVNVKYHSAQLLFLLTSIKLAALRCGHNPVCARTDLALIDDLVRELHAASTVMFLVQTVPVIRARPMRERVKCTHV